MGHVPETDDLMYGGDNGFWDLTNPQLDAGHDDYYQHGNGGCPDFDDSPYLVSSGTSSSTTTIVPAATTTMVLATTTTSTTVAPDHDHDHRRPSGGTQAGPAPGRAG